ncbi:MAG: hypothetical protein KDB53_21010, partial [Planctomycetes bacterium]|nr:hypothetical protein [Planctomycetota bacterium]
MTTDRVSEDLILAVTLGDPQGIGPEVSVKAIEALSAEDARLQFLVFGHPVAFERAGGAPRATASGRLRFMG